MMRSIPTSFATLLEPRRMRPLRTSRGVANRREKNRRVTLARLDTANLERLGNSLYLKQQVGVRWLRRKPVLS
jgi:hypothetical protein